MRVKLISITQNPIDIMWTAARTCYSEKSPIEMWEERYSKIQRFGDKENYNREFCEKSTKKLMKMNKIKCGRLLKKL